MRYILLCFTSFLLSLITGSLFLGATTPAVTTVYASSVQSNPQEFGLVIPVSPSEDDVPAILDLLRSYHAHATFVLDQSWAKRNSALVKRIVTEGHEVKYQWESRQQNADLHR